VKKATTRTRSSQTNAIVIRIRKERAREFERLFAKEELPIWKDFHAKGKLRAASLTRIEYGVEEDERFKAFLRKAQRWQPEGPSVWGGRTVFRVNAE
jgi:hypothetical protein